MGAGILPVALYKGQLYFLFGKERERPNETARGWADFGGGHEDGEKPIETAAREGAEESSGFLGNRYKIANKLKKRKVTIKTDNKQYTTYVLPIEYDENLPKYFNNQISFLKTYVNKKELNNTTMYEKEQLRWFPLSSLLRYKSTFRPFYREIVGKLVSSQKSIRFLFRKSTNTVKRVPSFARKTLKRDKNKV